jgi:hypothetical protein
MIKRPTIIMLALFVVVLASAALFQRWQAGQETAAPTPTVVSYLLAIDDTAVQALRVEAASGAVTALSRAAGQEWAVSQPEAGPADQAAVQSALTQLAGLRVITTLAGAPDLSIFGLDSPDYTLTLTMSGGQTYRILVGDLAPTENAYYVRLNENDPQVVNKYSLDAVLRLLEQPPYEPTPTPELDSELEPKQPESTPAP